MQVLAGDVVNGNAANATYQGQALGNLAAGSSATQLTNLINKWFLGTDLPTLCNTSLVYKSAAGSLFPHTPSHTDEYQGDAGRLLLHFRPGHAGRQQPGRGPEHVHRQRRRHVHRPLLHRHRTEPSTTTATAASAPASRNNVGTADYVTVNRMLPTSTTGMLAYADYGASYTNAANSLWIPLAEKAYAQWNQTGKEGRDGTNAYASIQGGWMATVDAQVLGYNATDYIMTTTSEQVADQRPGGQEGGDDRDPVVVAAPIYGLYANHAYAIIGYNAATDTFTLYNPWGIGPAGPAHVEPAPGDVQPNLRGRHVRLGRRSAAHRPRPTR